MSVGGYYFTLSGGRFVYTGDVGQGGSPGDGSLCVTGSTADLNTVSQAINDGAIAIPMPLTGRWTVTWQAILNAQSSGVRAVVTPVT